MAQCFEISLLPGVKSSEFEKAAFTQVFPKLLILRRNVRATNHRLLKVEGADSAHQKYIWLVFTSLVGNTPETAGQGPDVLASDMTFIDEASKLLAKYGKISTFTEVASSKKSAGAGSH